MVTRSIERPGVYSSAFPCEEVHAWWRLVGHFKRLGTLAGRVRRIERATGVRAEKKRENDE
jgi:hypothetical protein